MIADIILSMVKVDSRTVVSVLIANIRSKFNYTHSYRNAWIAKQKALEIIHNGWDASYNEDSNRRILPIAFTITLREKVDD
ncbi:hypothetical protein PVK06_024913 [Gossypium arboreum]|uniref:Uncharacterized protein n=1 Tax=Gossypium arboreum TaxID=29729 RepID=A0ABR0PFF0_GOSAR|nr:hypothetical protein PVK06_024913 [Gossypium arboreum]